VREGTARGHEKATEKPINLLIVSVFDFDDKSKVLEEGVYVDRYLAAEQVIPENAEKPEATAAGADMQRGRLLYETHCIACHTTEAHWREKRIVRSWTDLLYQVSRWQKNAGQDWSSEEINDVGAFLNDTFYKMP
jgi:hypothetical protein